MIVRCLYDQLVAIADLKLNPRNPNRHPTEQVAQLAKILAYQGWRYPVKVSKQSGMVTTGHGRIAAALLNGWTEVPVNFQDYETPDQEFADVVADNAIGQMAELNLSMVNAEIPGLDPTLNLELLGIKDFKVDPSEKPVKQALCPNCGTQFPP